MFGLRRAPPKVATQDSVRQRSQASPSSNNPFDSDTEPVNKATQKPARRTSSESALKVTNSKGNPFDDDDEEENGGEDFEDTGPSSALKPRNSRTKVEQERDRDKGGSYDTGGQRTWTSVG